MKKIALIFILITRTIYGYTQVPVEYAESLQSIINSYQGVSSIPGISAAVMIKDVGVWQGSSGESHSGVSLDTSMLLGIASNTKLFTSVLCLKLVEHNIITLDDSLHQWLPKYAYVDSNITIRQLLQHQSGVDNFTSNPDFSTYLDSSPTTVWTPQDVLNLIGPPNFEAGTSYAYSNTGYILAGLVLESATGISYSTLVRDSILIPLGLNNTFLEGLEPVIGTQAHPWYGAVDLFSTPRIAIGSSAWSAGCIVSTTSDIVKWYDAVFNQNFITQQSLNELTNFLRWPEVSYSIGLGLFKLSYNSKIYWGHSGGITGYNSYCLFDPIYKHSVAVIRNNSSSNSWDIANALAKKISELTNPNTGIYSRSNKKYRIYPNPNSDILLIEDFEQQLISVYIINVLGQIIYQLSHVNEALITINTSGFPNGNYFVVLVNKNGSVTSERIITLHN